MLQKALYILNDLISIYLRTNKFKALSMSVKYIYKIQIKNLSIPFQIIPIVVCFNRIELKRLQLHIYHVL